MVSHDTRKRFNMGDVGEIKRFLDTVKTTDEIDKN